VNKLAKNFLESLKAQLGNSASFIDFIQNETYLGGKPFSFVDHEYQLKILEIIEERKPLYLVVGKCSQIGISELFHRLVLARMAIRPGTSVVISFPTKTQSLEVTKTRVSNIIETSPRLASLINKDVDSASVKQFGNSSILFSLGGSKTSDNSKISRPVCTLLVDEIDRQNDKTVSSYRARMQHTKEEQRMIFYVSTPTAAGIGVDYHLSNARTLFIAHVLCPECGGNFLADYYEHVKLPGFDESLKYLTNATLAILDPYQAYLECPLCFAKLYNNWTTYWEEKENPLGKRGKIGVALDPFVAPAIIPMSDLVSASLEYTDYVEWLNQGLGKVADLKDSSIQREHIKFEHSDQITGQYIAGIDLGKLNHITIGVLRPDTSIHVTEIHVVKLPDLDDFIEKLFTRIRFSAVVVDSMPYTDKVYKLVAKYSRMFSAIYVDPIKPMPELFKLQMTDKYDEVVRQVTINKNSMMDLFANSLEHFFTFEPSPLEGLLVQHMSDMRRVRDWERSEEELRYKWVKSKNGVDHGHHSMIYLFTAAKLAAADVVNDFCQPITIRKFKNRN